MTKMKQKKTSEHEDEEGNPIFVGFKAITVKDDSEEEEDPEKWPSYEEAKEEGEEGKKNKGGMGSAMADVPGHWRCFELFFGE